MKLKLNKSGGVDFILISGNDKVKSTMLSSEAQDLVQKGEVEKKNGQIIVNGKFIFDLEGVQETKIEPQKDEKPVEDKPLIEAVKEDAPIVKKPRRKNKK